MKRFRRLGWVVAAAAFAAAATIRLPYYAEGPGPTREVMPLITFEGRERYESSGKLVLTTVRLYPVTGLRAFTAWLDPDWRLVDEDVLFGGTTEEKETERAISQMDQSKIDATFVVLGALAGYPRQHGEGALIESTIEGCPAHGVLYPGDVVLEIDGEPVETAREASRLIEAAAPGESLEFRVDADGQIEEVSFVREKCRQEEDRELVGIHSLPAFPFEVSMSSDEVGGPSGGLMWALGLYDLLTPEDITAWRTIAGTGVIGLDGKVYPIEGIRDKVVAAREAGATLFLAPVENAPELDGVDTGGMQVIAVGSFEEALEALGVQGERTQA